MRFVFAIVAFVIAAGLIVYGIAQRTVLAPDDRVVSNLVIDGDAAYTVIDGSVLNSFPGQQRLRASGSDVVFAAYARSGDIQAWLGTEPYNSVAYDSEEETLTSKVIENPPAEAEEVLPTPDEEATAEEGADGENADESASEGATEEETAPPAPAGSDLWLDETSAENSLTWTVNVPDDISLLLASDGTEPAPSAVSVSWPLSHSTPFAGPLIIGGGVLLLIGLGLYIWGLIHMRRTRGPRRKPPQKMPKLPAPPRASTQRPRALEPETTAKGRRSSRKIIAALALAGASSVLLAGCVPGEVSEYFGEAPLPSPTTSASAQAEREITPVAVTETQMERIVADIGAVAADADANRNNDLLKTRFAGPALREREANYAVRGADGGFEAPDPIPTENIRIDLPEATDTWPRRVLAVVSSDDEATAPTVLVLIQETPRENYLVHYAMRLQADIDFPAVAPPSVGAAVIAPDNRLLAVEPQTVGSQYADILANGSESPAFPLFAETPDGLRTQVGFEEKNERRANFPQTATLEFSNAEGTGTVVGFATNESGAIVATDVIEQETARPTEEGATVNPEGRVKALSGVSSTGSGIETTYAYQLLFYVPPSTAESEQIVLLGYSQGLISAREL